MSPKDATLHSEPANAILNQINDSIQAGIKETVATAAAPTFAPRKSL